MSTDPLAFLTYLNVLVYGIVAVAAWRVHQRSRSVRSLWLVATFATLVLVVTAGAVLPDVTAASSAVLRLVDDIQIVVLLLFPYCLYRFASAFRRPSRVVDIGSVALLAALAVWTFVLPVLPEDRADFTTGSQLYVFAVLAYWTLLSTWVAVQLLRGGVGQPGVAKRRMQLLAGGALLLNVALLVAGTAAGSDSTGLRLITTMLGWLSAVLFLFGFAPPGGLRHAWRQREERRLRQAEADLMTAGTPEEVAATILPHVAELLGGHGAALLDQAGEPLASEGFTAEELRGVSAEPEREHEGRVVLPLESGWLVVQSTVYAPFFGDEELDLLRSLGTFVDLALSRIALFEQDAANRQELQRTNDELTALVYGISHDLRSPIVTVIGYLELLSTDAADQLGAEARHYLDRISFSARYMDSLIRDLLELSRIGRTQTEGEPVHLADLVEDIATELHRSHPGARVVTRDLPTVHMNAVRARQLFTNLMENATRHGGRDDITISVTGAMVSPGEVTITVADDGVGIAEPYRERVFGIFERLDTDHAPTTGTGIGLTMCRKIVEQLGGSIWIDAAPAGTTFKIALPTAVPQQSNPNVEVQRQ